MGRGTCVVNARGLVGGGGCVEERACSARAAGSRRSCCGADGALHGLVREAEASHQDLWEPEAPSEHEAPSELVSLGCSVHEAPSELVFLDHCEGVAYDARCVPDECESVKGVLVLRASRRPIQIMGEVSLEHRIRWEHGVRSQSQ